MSQPTTSSKPREPLDTLNIVPFSHPQGCRSFLLWDTVSRQALALDVHLDLVEAIADEIRSHDLSLVYVVDSHTHADHPSGAGTLAQIFGSTRVAHERSGHAGVEKHPNDGDVLQLGDQSVTVYHTPGHTLDHLALATATALFSGDTLLIGSVARTDFLGGDAGVLFDSIHRLLALLPRETHLYPSHDYYGHLKSSLADELANNPWLQIEDRDAFVKNLTANPPPRPPNMDELIRMNREGKAAPPEVSAGEAVEQVGHGSQLSILDVRTDAEHRTEHIAGSTHIPLDQLIERIDEVRAVPAPRLLLCRSGSRAEAARDALRQAGVSATSVITGGLEDYKRAGGATERSNHMSLERQVRIGAGSLVVLGVVLGYTVHSYLFVLSGLVGCGLIVAGVTDWCGMALLLARMPWNRRSADNSTSTPPAGTCSATVPSCSASLPEVE